ncbi:hypothetical protein [Leptospira hartskeerlii]|uniref:hypothetical protein n=1 Tax=Leptospira hartskeerlii TaxID=2023177 RepID=UPI001FAFB6FA|nr:hypothetical protein [Leptospira hartskeerlii]
MRFFFIISILFAFLSDCGSIFEKISPFSIPPQEFDLGNGVKAVFLPTELSFITSKGRILEFSVQEPFLSSAKGEQIVNYRKATFKIKDKIILECGSQSIESLGFESGALVVQGKLIGKNCETEYSIRFVSSSNSGLDWKVEISNPELNRTFIKFKSDGSESIYGLGEQFSHLNLKGKKSFLFSEEQGVGRGDQPIFFTSRNRAFFFENSSYSVFDFEEDSEIVVEFRERGFSVKSWKAASPKEILKLYTSKLSK